MAEEIIQTKFGLTLKNATQEDLTILKGLSNSSLEEYLRKASKLGEKEETKGVIRIIRKGMKKEEEESKDAISYFFLDPDTTQHWELIGKFFKVRTTAGALLRMKAYAKEKGITSPYKEMKGGLYFEIESRCKYKKLLELKDLLTRIGDTPKSNIELPSMKSINTSLKNHKSMGYIDNDKGLVEAVTSNYESDMEDGFWSQIRSVPEIEVVE